MDLCIRDREAKKFIGSEEEKERSLEGKARSRQRDGGMNFLVDYDQCMHPLDFHLLGRNESPTKSTL